MLLFRLTASGPTQTLQAGALSDRQVSESVTVAFADYGVGEYRGGSMEELR
jgi:hypothetical protein